MPIARSFARTALLLLLVGVLVFPPWAGMLDAASHREAPLIAMDPAADITDVFFFRSYEPGMEDKVILIMNVFPGGEPSSGPNYFYFDPTVRYSFHIDNDQDGRADDVRIDVRFRSEFRGIPDQLGLFLSYVGCAPTLTPPASCASPIPPITALDGPGSEGLGLRQKYTVTITRGDGSKTFSSAQSGKPLIAVPSYVGPRTMGTMANYEALAAQGVYSLDNGLRVFAGQRGDPFYIDLGAVFDTVNLGRHPPLLTAAEDANDNVNPFGNDMIGSLNVQTIALEVPARMLLRGDDNSNSGSGSEGSDGSNSGSGSGTSSGSNSGPGSGESDDDEDDDEDQGMARSKLGMYASTSRRQTTVLTSPGSTTFFDNSDENGSFVQVQRLANPLINETIIGTEDKDRWNAHRPDQESAFLDYYLNPRLAQALQLIFGVPAATSGRTDLVNLLLRYNNSDSRLSELLRLDLSVPATPLPQQRRLTNAIDPTGDPAAWPNGRRPKDDVTDIAVRVVGGPNYVGARAGDGVNRHFAPTSPTFPFLATPQNGRDRMHQNPPRPGP
ncbi:MAG TPA: DUF4331 domain-containing protein [Chloroflexota bacterium]|jgi:hypothetical protein|nr:DUF4331 domain-containing protein [Chloroflexota bacterium]